MAYVDRYTQAPHVKTEAKIAKCMRSMLVAFGDVQESKGMTTVTLPTDIPLHGVLYTSLLQHSSREPVVRVTFHAGNHRETVVFYDDIDMDKFLDFSQRVLRAIFRAVEDNTRGMTKKALNEVRRS